MKKYSIILLGLSLALFSCKKFEGEGGRSSIKGKIFMSDKTGSNQGEYFAPDFRVHIIYGDESETYDDDMKTSYDGSFEFKNLRQGNYTVFAYSEIPSEPSGLRPVIVSTVIGKNETVDIGTIEVEK